MDFVLNNEKMFIKSHKNEGFCINNAEFCSDYNDTQPMAERALLSVPG